MDDLLTYLSTGERKVIVDRLASAQELHESIERGFVLLKFPETQGGTELGVRLGKSRVQLAGADFNSGRGTIHLVGSLVLNYHEIELAADIELATMQGTGRVTIVADEKQWRAKSAARSGATAH